MVFSLLCFQNQWWEWGVWKLTQSLQVDKIEQHILAYDVDTFKDQFGF